ncbi:hypothetical protein BV378_14195 [Nostoc sp. RF31YmG]|jgi:hypothetical protein|nr:hypothetical protein BV378_14195 [Nostoc sp. RF31YmG]
MRIAAILIASVALAGCAHQVKHPVPESQPVTPAPLVIGIPQTRYVPIDKELTATCSWVRNGALEDMPEVSRGRKLCLDFYEAHLREIAAKQGGPAVEAKP